MKSKVDRGWWGTVVLFLVHGLVVASWLSRIPAVQTALRLSNKTLGITLLSSAVGAMCSIPLTGWLVHRFGSKRTTVVASLLFCLSVILPGLAINAPTLAAALYFFGATAAAMDVSMNAQGVEVEKALGKPTMSRFHAMFSLGAMGGAAVGGSVAAAGYAPLMHFAGSSILNLLLVLGVSGLLFESHGEGQDSSGRLPLRKMPPVLIAVSAIGFCILLSEGAMADWTAVYLQQVLRAGPGTAAAGFAVFSGAMAVFRLLGDMITTRLGPLRTIRTACLTASVGLIWALSMSSPKWAMPGFAATGAGLSVIIPLVFGSGGRVKGISPGAGIATVTGLGYLGFIVGPPTIGIASEAFTLRYALYVVVLCCLAGAALSGFMSALEQPSVGRPAESVTV